MGQSYTDLVAWKKVMELVMEGYQLRRAFLPEGLYGLTSQMAARGQLAPDLRMFVRAVVVHDQVHIQRSRDVRLEMAEELEKLLETMAPLAPVTPSTRLFFGPSPRSPLPGMERDVSRPRPPRSRKPAL